MSMSRYRVQRFRKGVMTRDGEDEMIDEKSDVRRFDSDDDGSLDKEFSDDGVLGVE